MTQTLLSRSQILEAVDLDFEDVEVPEWGGPVRLQQMNAEESSRFTKRMREINETTGDQNGMYLMLIHSARDLAGNLLFTEEDLPALKKKSIDVLNRLQRVALKLNKMGVVEELGLKKGLSVAATAATPTP